MAGKDFTSIIKNNIFPIVPIWNYGGRPYLKWGRKENFIKNIKELEAMGAIYKTEEDGKKMGGQLTGMAIITGEKSRIMVIDLDMNHKDGVDGIESFNNIIKDFTEEEKESILNTFTVKTPRGGNHLYFKYKKGLTNKANYAPGIDIRSDGGIIISPHTKKRVDGEIREYTVEKDNDIQDMPEVLFNVLLELNKSKRKINTEKSKQISNTESLELSKYYKTVNEGQGRDEALISWLGYTIKKNPTLRNKTSLLPYAITYNKCWFKPPLDDNEVEKKVDSILNYALPCYCDPKGNIDNWELVQYIMKGQPCYKKGNLIFMYDDKKGYYDFLELDEIKKSYFAYAINNKEKTALKSKSFAELLMLNVDKAHENMDSKRYINCLNGVIDINTNELLPHDPKYKLDVRFNANFILEDWKEKFNNSLFKVFLNDILDKGSLETLQESWGLMLSPHAKEVQNCFIYKGEGSNGKSTACDIQEALIEDSDLHICGIGLGDFGEDFVISMAEGKFVNIVRDDELSGKTIHKFFKSMVCGDAVTINRKNRDLVRMPFNMTMFFGLNRMPSASDKSVGFFRRPIIIPFDSSFGTEEEVAKGTRDKLKKVGLSDEIIEKELDLVFMWAYEGLQRLKTSKWEITVSEASVKEMEEYREEADSSYAFFNDKVISKKGERISKAILYARYKSWCGEGTTPMNINQFGRQLKSFGVKDFKSNSVKYWTDITYKLLTQVEKEESNPFTKEVQ